MILNSSFKNKTFGQFTEKMSAFKFAMTNERINIDGIDIFG